MVTYWKVLEIIRHRINVNENTLFNFIAGKNYLPHNNELQQHF